jgi:hypothetical protein
MPQVVSVVLLVFYLSFWKEVIIQNSLNVEQNNQHAFDTNSLKEGIHGPTCSEDGHDRNLIIMAS